jgi:hypothetical protein
MSDLARNFRKWAPFEMQFEAKSYPENLRAEGIDGFEVA